MANLGCWVVDHESILFVAARLPPPGPRLGGCRLDPRLVPVLLTVKRMIEFRFRAMDLHVLADTICHHQSSSFAWTASRLKQAIVSVIRYRLVMSKSSLEKYCAHIYSRKYASVNTKTFSSQTRSGSFPITATED
jgi:hypothetical protein